MAIGLVDTYIAYRFIKMLATPFKRMKVYELGIIDEKGRRIHTPEADDAARKAGIHYSNLHKIVINLKRLLARIPAGKTTIAGFAAALWLLKEEVQRMGGSENLAEDMFKMYTEEHGISFDALNESFLLENTLLPGKYKLEGKTIVIDEKLNSIGEVFGIPVFQHNGKVFAQDDLEKVE